MAVMIPYLDQSIEALDQSDLAASASGTGGVYTRVKHRLASEVADLIALIDKGVITHEEYDRAYIQAQHDVSQEFARKREEAQNTQGNPE